MINALSARLGGGQTYLKNILKYMPEFDDLEVLLIAPEGVNFPCNKNVTKFYTKWPVENPLSRAIWEKLVLPFLLIKWNADVFFCPGGVVASHAPSSCRVVTMFRNMIPFDKKVREAVPFGFQRLRNIILYQVMLKSMSQADLTIFISDYARGIIQSLKAIPNPVTIPHGLNENFRVNDRVLDRPASVPTTEYLLYVSRFETYKHHREVVRAYAGLPEQFRDQYKLLLVGETNMPEADAVAGIVAELGLSEQIVFSGAIEYERLPAVYQHAKLILFASSCENCPNILLEALGSGRPVLSSNVDPMPEFGGDAVEYFSPFDPESISNAMRKVLSDSSLEQHLVCQGMKRSERYDWSKTATETWSRILSLK
ncbi:glycosyltransferase family 4 protein [Marinobacter caseinilyticus]|uniref:glycosyltransferase family 4 protein n=1 Tax=Marinobacter caseinilyticus TaxID=2692195 RepID=UPI001F2C6D4E|nr:glycosyltransferase family 1 protein [Marinobacter caseinilyticus]